VSWKEPASGPQGEQDVLRILCKLGMCVIVVYTMERCAPFSADLVGRGADGVDAMDRLGNSMLMNDGCACTTIDMPVTQGVLFFLGLVQPPSSDSLS
jgi:hypothetical protein